VWLASGVENLRPSVRQGGRHDQVLGAGDGGEVEDDARSLQPAGRSGDEFRRSLEDLGPHRPQAADVLLHPAGTDLVSARSRQLGLAGPGQQGAQEHDRGTHPAGQAGRNRARDLFRSQLEGSGPLLDAGSAQGLEDLPHERGVRDDGDVP
jgi:hypothetical protein